MKEVQGCTAGLRGKAHQKAKIRTVRRKNLSPWEEIAVDFLTWNKPSVVWGAKYTLVIIDYRTGFLVTQNCRTRGNASERVIHMITYMKR